MSEGFKNIRVSEGLMFDMTTTVFSMICISHNSSGLAISSLLSVLKTIMMFFPFSSAFFLLENFFSSASYHAKENSFDKHFFLVRAIQEEPNVLSV